MASSIENAVFLTLQAAVTAAQNGDKLFGAELHDTVYRPIKQDFGLRVGDASGDIAPTPGGEDVEEYDAVLLVVCYARVPAQELSNRLAARDHAVSLAKGAAQVFYQNPTMGGRVIDSLPRRIRTGYDTIDTKTFAIAHLYLVVNQTGQQVDVEAALRR